RVRRYPRARAFAQQRDRRALMNHSATAFAPASVGNIGVGFDLLGHAIDGPRDLATVRRIAEPQVRIDAIGGDIAGADTLPLDPRRNTAGGALLALRDALGLPYGFALELHRGLPLGGVALATEARALRIAAPDWLHAVVVHPDQVLETRRSREVLAAPYPLADVVRQGAHLAQFLLGLQHDDADLLRDGLRDVLIE